MEPRIGRICLLEEESGSLGSEINKIKMAVVKFSSVFCLGVVALTIAMVSAVTDDEKKNIREAVVPLLKSCGEEYSINKEDILAAKEAKNVDALNPCFYACVMKKVGTINDQGLYDAAVAKETHKKYIQGQEDLAKFDSITDTCTSVNDEAVTDGVQGCERAKKVVRCLIDNKSVFSPISLQNFIEGSSHETT